MNYAEKHIVKTYSKLFEGLSVMSKIELIEYLSKSLKADKHNTEDDFYNSFGKFSSEKSAEEIIAEIKSSRKFREKELEF